MVAQSHSDKELSLPTLVSIDDHEATTDFEPARLNLQARSADL